jgi:hypothetical protein
MAHLAQTRDLLLKQWSALKAKINNLLSAEGINLKRETLSSNKALQRVLALPLSPILATDVRVLIEQIRSLSGRIAELEEVIEEQGPSPQEPDQHQGYRSVSAGPLLSAIGNIGDFADPGRLAVYFGLVPRV